MCCAAAPQPLGGGSTQTGQAARAGRYQGGFRRGFLILVASGGGSWRELQLTCPHGDFFLFLQDSLSAGPGKDLLYYRRASRDNILMVAAGVPDIEHVGGGSSFQNQKGVLAAAEGSCAALTASDGVSRSLLSLLPKAAAQISCGKTCLLLGLSPLPRCFFGCICAPGLLCCASKAPAPVPRRFWRVTLCQIILQSRPNASWQGGLLVMGSVLLPARVRCAAL